MVKARIAEEDVFKFDRDSMLAQLNGLATVPFAKEKTDTIISTLQKISVHPNPTKFHPMQPPTRDDNKSDKSKCLLIAL